MNLRQPVCVRDYNAKMGGVDVFDQHIAAYGSLRKTDKYWKTIVINFLDAVSVNCNILFKMYRAANPELIQRPRGYVAADFRSALICQLAGIAEDDPTVPLFKPAGRRSVNQLPPGNHVVCHMAAERSFRRCSRMEGIQRKCQSMGVTCNIYLHTNHRN